MEWYCRVLGAKDVWRGRNDEGGYRACAIREPDPDGIALEFYLLRPR